MNMISEEKKCFLCGSRNNLQKHHCHHGIRRKAADRFDLCVWLCAHCHQLLHDKGLHDRDLQMVAQKHFEMKYGHEKWMEIFGKNYL